LQLADGRKKRLNLIAFLSTDVVGELMSDELLWIGDVEPKPTNSAQDRNL
jgi:hypothetical protein